MTSSKNGPDAVASLLAALDDHDGLARQAARQQLVARGRVVTPELLPLLTHHHAHVRWEATKALAELADPAGANALIPVLKDDDPDVRWVAAEALAAIGKPAIAPLLEAVILEGDHPDLRDGAHHVLHDLTDPQLRDLVAPVYRELSGVAASADTIIAAEHVLKRLTAATG